MGEYLKRARLDRRLGEKDAAREIGCDPGNRWVKDFIANLAAKKSAH